MAKRLSVTERLAEYPPIGRGFQAIVGGVREGRKTRRTEGQPAGIEPRKLVKATFLLDQESLDILDRIWLRQRKREGCSKSELVRRAIRLLTRR